MYKQDLALNNLQELIYHKIQPTHKPIKIKTVQEVTYYFSGEYSFSQ